jgi:hypothetical protein
MRKKMSSRILKRKRETQRDRERRLRKRKVHKTFSKNQIGMRRQMMMKMTMTSLDGKDNKELSTEAPGEHI